MCLVHFVVTPLAHASLVFCFVLFCVYLVLSVAITYTLKTTPDKRIIWLTTIFEDPNAFITKITLSTDTIEIIKYAHTQTLSCHLKIQLHKRNAHCSQIEFISTLGVKIVPPWSLPTT